MADQEPKIAPLGKHDHVDPVCGMVVNEKQAAGKSSYSGEKYYFCSQDCKDKFELAPEEYAVSIVPK